MKFIIGMLVIVGFNTQVLAQDAANNIVDVSPQQSQIEVINEPVTVQTVTTTVEQTPVVIQNQPNIQVQKQAATIVEDSPLSESTADKLRRQRIDLEQKVESKIVEKLEQDRMKAEQERLEKLFAEPSTESKIEVNQQQVIEPQVIAPTMIAPVQVVQPDSTVSPIEVEQSVITETAPVAEVKTEYVEVKAEETKKSNTTLGVDLGFLNYNNADNVGSSGAFGISIGYETEDRFIIEGSFRYSKADVEAVNRPYAFSFWAPTTIYPTITEMQQYNISGAFKYRIFNGKISPTIGGLLSYVYRDYEDRQYFDYKLTANSTAIDFGLLVGGDVKLSNNLKLTAEYAYIMNVTYDISLDGGRLEPSRMWGDSLSQPIEEVGYSNFMLSLKYIF